jgi:tetratricopeptide (TPR) repeat protein
VQRSEGVPLFLEELTRSAVEAVRRGDAAVPSTAGESPGEGGVPATLQTVVQSRLGRWPDLKPIVQAASVLGREFPLRLLEQLLSDRGKELRSAVGRLVEHGLIAAQDALSSQPLRFKHALIHEAVYQTMLRSDRQRLHSRAAEILKQHYLGLPESAPDVLAHHLVVAQRFEEAVHCLSAAGAETAARAAYVESIGHSQAALTLIDKLQDASGRSGLQRQLLTQLGVALAATRGYATPEVEQTYQQARSLCDDAADPAALFPIVRGLATFYFVRCDLQSADQLAAQCIKLADQAQRDDLMIEALSFRGYASVYLGRLAEGRSALDSCVALYRSRAGETFTYPSPQDAGTAAWSLLGIAAWLQGDTQASDAAVADALAHAQKLARPFDQAYVHVWIAMLRNMQRRFDEAQQHATACVEICARHGFNTWLVAATMHSCISTASRGPSEESIAVLRQALGAFIHAGAQANAPFFLWGVARGLRMTGQVREAQEAIAEAKQRADATGEAYLKSELLMLEAEGESDAACAQALLTQAMEMAESQGALLLALRAALQLLERIAPAHERSSVLRSASQALEGTAACPVARDWVQAALAEARQVLARIASSLPA